MRSLSVSPHVHGSNDTIKSMYYVILALLPACIWGVYAFGLRALLVLVISIVSAVLTEYLLGLISKENTIMDGTAFLTGLLIGMNMPAMVPLFIPVIASIFAIAVVKWTFGGLGQNWMNPALAGRVFVFFSFTSGVSAFSSPKRILGSVVNVVSSATTSSASKVVEAVDVLSSATPLTQIKTAGFGKAGDVLNSLSTPISSFAETISNSTGIDPYTIDAFFGNVAGCIGEVSAILLLAGGIFLIIKKIITWHIPVIYLASFALLSWVFGGIPAGNGMFSGDILLPLFSGGLMLGAFFMATDWVTTPNTKKGEVVFALGCGLFTFIIRYFGSLPEGVSLAIIFMNILTPTINKYCTVKKFGLVKEKKEKAVAK